MCILVQPKENKRKRKINVMLFHNASIIMLFADISVESKYSKPTVMDYILWCENKLKPILDVRRR